MGCMCTPGTSVRRCTATHPPTRTGSSPEHAWGHRTILFTAYIYIHIYICMHGDIEQFFLQHLPLSENNLPRSIVRSSTIPSIRRPPRPEGLMCVCVCVCVGVCVRAHALLGGSSTKTKQFQFSQLNPHHHYGPCQLSLPVTCL
jgi:hypothetical protein